MRCPFQSKLPNKKRKEPRRVRSMCDGGHPRERITGQARSARRKEIFERAGGQCEGKVYQTTVRGELLVRCPNPATQWSHHHHGSRKCDHMNCGIASCDYCHDNVHNPKSVPRRPGRVMRKAEALKYWRGKVCFCGGSKPSEHPFCNECLDKLSPKKRLDLNELTNADWLTTVAECEMTILQAIN